MKRLRVPPLGEQQSPWTTFKVGLFSGSFIVLLIAVVLSGECCYNNNKKKESLLRLLISSGLTKMLRKLIVMQYSLSLAATVLGHASILYIILCIISNSLFLNAFYAQLVLRLSMLLVNDLNVILGFSSYLPRGYCRKSESGISPIPRATFSR